jgi:chromosome segregation ATPase
MKQGRVARQVEETTRGIISADEQIRALAEQLATWEEMREDLHVRALVSETPQATAELSGVERQCDLARAALADQRSRKGQLEQMLEELMIEWEPKVVS